MTKSESRNPRLEKKKKSRDEKSMNQREQRNCESDSEGGWGESVRKDRMSQRKNFQILSFLVGN